MSVCQYVPVFLYNVNQNDIVKNHDWHFSVVL